MESHATYKCKSRWSWWVINILLPKCMHPLGQHFVMHLTWLRDDVYQLGWVSPTRLLSRVYATNLPLCHCLFEIFNMVNFGSRRNLIIIIIVLGVLKLNSRTVLVILPSCVINPLLFLLIGVVTILIEIFVYLFFLFMIILSLALFFLEKKS